MIDKEKSAQKFAEILLETGIRGEWDMLELDDMYAGVAHDAWKLADAMQAESDKRKPKGVPEVLEFKIDWSLAPEGFNWWAMDKCGVATWFKEKPLVGSIVFQEEFVSGGEDGAIDAPSFNFTGNWKDSLTERPNE